MISIVESFPCHYDHVLVSDIFYAHLRHYSSGSTHVFRGFFHFSDEGVEQNVLPLIGEPVVFLYAREKLYFIHTKYFSDGAKSRTAAAYPFAFAVSMGHKNDLSKFLTLGLYDYVGPQPHLSNYGIGPWERA